ncbi:Bug family tripartite tricarboxylate transporter substrate binding protein [Xanthobacter wiegelii]|uniref:Bug family tripartite tricarboxylate transporter substrate binding protein n=1 Tax=Xanthobacter wiegelii TaxID=3119913 RepID=UPI00372C8E7B
MKSNALKLILASCAALVCASVPGKAEEAYPTRPIRLVVGFSPGGPTDIVARQLAKHMGTTLGQQIVVENRPGANSNIAALEVAQSRPDGYTVLYNTSSIAISPALYKNLKYDVKTAFEPVGLAAEVPIVLETNPKLGVGTMEAFKAFLKKKGGDATFSSTGNGSITQLAAVLVMNKLGEKAVHVPYPGSAPALIDLSTGVVDFMADTANSSLPFLKDGRLRGIAVTSAERLKQLPELPTLKELGLQDAQIGAWQGILAPAGTPKPIIDKLNAAMMKALSDPEVRASLDQQATTPLGSTPEEYRRYLLSEIERWKGLVEVSNISMN